MSFSLPLRCLAAAASVLALSCPAAVAAPFAAEAGTASVFSPGLGLPALGGCPLAGCQSAQAAMKVSASLAEALRWQGQLIRVTARGRTVTVPVIRAGVRGPGSRAAVNLTAAAWARLGGVPASGQAPVRVTALRLLTAAEQARYAASGSWR